MVRAIGLERCDFMWRRRERLEGQGGKLKGNLPGAGADAQVRMLMCVKSED